MRAVQAMTLWSWAGPNGGRKPGRSRGALALDGIDDFITTPFVLDPSETPFSVFAWVKADAPGQVILCQTGGANWLAADESGFPDESVTPLLAGAWPMESQRIQIQPRVTVAYDANGVCQSEADFCY